MTGETRQPAVMQADNRTPESKMPTWHFLRSKQRILPGGTRGRQQWLGRPDNDWHAGPSRNTGAQDG